MNPANARCHNRQDQLAAGHRDPHHHALQRAVDAYYAERQRAEGFSGISLPISPSATEPAIDVASGSTSFRVGAISADQSAMVALLPKTVCRAASKGVAPEV